MMAYVLIRCEIDSVLDAIDEIDAVEGVESVSPVTGKYDVVAELEVDSTEEIRDIVAGDVHRAKGVAETTTCIAT